MKTYFILGVAVLFTLPLRTNAAVVTSADIVSIAIDSTWSGLAKPRAYHDVIERQGSAFVRSGGSVVNDGDVERFVNALSRPHPASLVAADVGLTPAALVTAMPDAERCLQGGLSMPAVRAEFEREYLDSAALQQSLDFWFRKPKMWTISDVYPSLSILVKTKTTAIRVVSSSQRPFMLPFLVDAGAEQEEVNDGTLALAVGSLLPPGTVNRNLFLTQSAITNWATRICNSSTIRDAIGNDGRAHVSWVAATFGMQLAGYAVSADLSSWNAEVRRCGHRIAATSGCGASWMRRRITTFKYFPAAGWLLGRSASSGKAGASLLERTSNGTHSKHSRFGYRQRASRGSLASGACLRMELQYSNTSATTC